MREGNTATKGARRPSLLLGVLLSAAVLSLLLSSLAQAQETPDGDAETPDGNGGAAPSDTVVRIVVDIAEPLASGEEFEADVVVDEVEHLSAFGFTIEYDPNAVEPVMADAEDEVLLPELLSEETFTPRILNLGEFLVPSERGSSMLCPLQVANGEVFEEGEEGEQPIVREDVRTLTVDCVTTLPPVCLDGAEGPSGSGRLATLVFKSKGKGSTTLRLRDSLLILDDARPPCDPETFRPEEIQHRREDALVALKGGGDGGSSNTAIWVTVAVVAVVAVAGVGGFLWYRRGAPDSSL